MNIYRIISTIAAGRPLGVVTFAQEYAPARCDVLTINPLSFTHGGYEAAIRGCRSGGHTARNVGIGVVAGGELIGSIAYWHEGEEPWIDAIAATDGAAVQVEG